MLEDFIEMSKCTGMIPEWIQAAGGNTSVKITDELMFIKSSGVRLCEMTKNFGYSLVNYQMILDYMKNTDEQTDDAEGEILAKALISGTRPSIETFLHSFTGKYTVHTHPAAANILLSTSGGTEELKQLFPDAVIADYCTPGLKLGKELYRTCMEQNADFSILFLKNHGLIVSGDTAEAVLEQTADVIEKISRYTLFPTAASNMTMKIYRTLKQCTAEFNGIVYHSENLYIHKMLTENGGKMWNYAFCPDCIVYCGNAIPDIDGSMDLLTRYMTAKGIPSVLVSDGEVYIIASDIKKAADIEAVLAFSAKTVLYAGNRTIESIGGGEQDFLMNWDAEKYRKQMK